MSLGVGLYLHGSVEAVKLYMDAFGLTLGYYVLNDDGGYFHSELMRGAEEILSVVEAKRDVQESPVQLGFTFDTREALERAYNLLKDGGIVNMEIGELPWSPCAAEVTDRFGVNWFLSLPQHRPPEDFTPSSRLQG